MENNNTHQENNGESTCEFCHAKEHDRPIFTTDYKGRKLKVCAKCLPGLIHG